MFGLIIMHIISLDVARLDSYYEDMMNQVYLDHHVYPTNLTSINLTQGELAQYAEYNSMVHYLAEQGLSGQDQMQYLPTGAQIITNPNGSKQVRIVRNGVVLKKKTIYQTDRRYSNGIPVGLASASPRPRSDIGCAILFGLAAVGWLAVLAWVFLG